jgi:hypothetical protein
MSSKYSSNWKSPLKRRHEARFRPKEKWGLNEAYYEGVLDGFTQFLRGSKEWELLAEANLVAARRSKYLADRNLRYWQGFLDAFDIKNSNVQIDDIAKAILAISKREELQEKGKALTKEEAYHLAEDMFKNKG